MSGVPAAPVPAAPTDATPTDATPTDAAPTDAATTDAWLRRARTDGALLVVGATSWDGVTGTEKQYALRLAGHTPVLWVDPHVSLLSPLRNRTAAGSLRGPRLRIAAPGVLRLTPLTVPGVSRPVLRDIAIRQARAAVRRAVRGLGVRITGTVVATLDDMLDVVPSPRKIFLGTDDYVAGAPLLGLDPGWLERALARQVRAADVTVAVSPVLVEQWSRLLPGTGGEVVLLPNGADVDHYAGTPRGTAAADVGLDRPRAGVVGQLSDRLDLALLEAVADAGIPLLLVGPLTPPYDADRMQALIDRPTVEWVGRQPFADMPDWLARIDVGLTPYTRSDFNRASFPLKTLEYLAAGLPVVATDLPAHRWLDAPDVTITDDPGTFVAAVRAALTDGDPAARAARRTFAERHSWERRTARLLDLLRPGTTTPAAPRPEVGAHTGVQPGARAADLITGGAYRPATTEE